MKYLKKFNESENSNSNIDIDEILDLVESEILDNYNSEVTNIFIGEETEVFTDIGKFKKVKYPGSGKSGSLRGYIEYIDETGNQADIIQDEITSIGDKSEFLSLSININMNLKYLTNHIGDISKSVKNLAQRISKMTDKRISDISKSENGYNCIYITNARDFDSYEIIDTNWEDVESDLNSLLNKSDFSNLILTFCFKFK